MKDKKKITPKGQSRLHFNQASPRGRGYSAPGRVPQLRSNHPRSPGTAGAVPALRAGTNLLGRAVGARLAPRGGNRPPLAHAGGSGAVRGVWEAKGKSPGARTPRPSCLTKTKAEPDLWAEKFTKNPQTREQRKINPPSKWTSR